jgi:drug/metabolite transporter (DMT)-like permease
VLPEASLPAPEMAGWVAFGFLAPTGYALGNIFNARWRPTDSASLALACGMLFGAAAWVAPTVLLTGSFHPIGLPPAAADWAIFGQILISSLAYVLLFELLRVAGVVYLSQVGYIVALTAIVWGGVLFGERYSVWIWAAMALILTGVALVNWRSSRDRRAS